MRSFAAVVFAFFAVSISATTAHTADAVTPSSKVAAPPPESQTPEGLGAQLTPAKGQGAKGSLSLSQDAGIVRLGGVLSGLAPTTSFLLSVQERGDCTESASAARMMRLGEVRSDAKGSAKVDLTVKDTRVQSGNLKDLAGKALTITQAAADTDAKGPSAWIACGVIK
jgi:hypothetical protein